MMISRQMLKKAHKASLNNKIILEKSSKCACFFCNNIYGANEITDWCHDTSGDTALCPYCGVDSVIGDHSGYPLTPEFILAMHRFWFGLNRPMGDGRKTPCITVVIED